MSLDLQDPDLHKADEHGMFRSFILQSFSHTFQFCLQNIPFSLFWHKQTFFPLDAKKHFPLHECGVEHGAQ